MLLIFKTFRNVIGAKVATILRFPSYTYSKSHRTDIPFKETDPFLSPSKRSAHHSQADSRGPERQPHEEGRTRLAMGLESETVLLDGGVADHIPESDGGTISLGRLASNVTGQANVAGRGCSRVLEGEGDR